MPSLCDGLCPGDETYSDQDAVYLPEVESLAPEPAPLDDRLPRPRSYAGRGDFRGCLDRPTVADLEESAESGDALRFSFAGGNPPPGPGAGNGGGGSGGNNSNSLLAWVALSVLFFAATRDFSSPRS